MKLGSGHTLTACFIGYISQAIIVNFAPLLFVTFNQSYGISLTLIGLLITVNFGVQLLVDLLAARFADRIGYRPLAVTAHLCCFVGLVLLAFLPDALPDPAVGLFMASVIYAIGGGLIEVLISPIVEACPYQNKKSVMSLLHSFYCWGQVGVVALSTLFFVAFGLDRWQVLALIWSIIPLLNGVFFLFVPLYSLPQAEGESGGIRSLVRSGIFWFFVVLMICSGSCEQAISQWASAFAETGLGVSKTLGDLLGPCMFAVMMGLSRVFFSRFAERLKLRTALLAASLGCVFSYALCAFSPLPWLGLVGCALVGFSVGIMWPGTFSYATSRVPKGGTAMFALLALAGDVGCMVGPSAVGAISDAFTGNLQIGIAFGLFFPILMAVILLFSRPTKPLSQNSGAEKNSKPSETGAH